MEEPHHAQSNPQVPDEFLIQGGEQQVSEEEPEVIEYGTALGEPEEQSHVELDHVEEHGTLVLDDTTNIGIAQSDGPETAPQSAAEPEVEEDEVAAKARRRVSKLPLPRTGNGLGYGSLRPPATSSGPRSPTTPTRPTTGKTLQAPKATGVPKPALAKPTPAPTVRKPAVPAATTTRPAGSTLRAPPTATRKVSNPSIRPTPAPAPVKKPSTTQLKPAPAAPTRKPSTSRLNAPAPTVVKKPSTSSLATPTVSRRVSSTNLSAPKLPTVAKKPSTPQLAKSEITVQKRSAPSAAPAPKKSYGALTSKPGLLDIKAPAPRRVTSAAPPASITGKGPVAKVATAATPKRQVSTPIRTKPAPPKTPQPPKDSPPESVTSSPKKQSLKEAIAAARKARKQSDTGTPTNVLDTFNFEIADPFNTGAGPNAGAELLKKRIASARTEGRLNISNMELKEIPAEVYKMYEVPVDSEDGSRWYDSIDLTRMIIADNEIESIGEELVKVFAALQSMDVSSLSKLAREYADFLKAHNNLLPSIPSNWNRLNRLSSLNLSNNKLRNDSLKDILSISTLVDLKLSKNNLTGAFPDELSNLKSLEVLEIYQNEIESLPDSISELTNLRNLNAGSNKLESIPSLAMKECHLVELILSSNRIKGTLFDTGVTELPHLQTLDIKSNRISALTEGNLLLPSLQQFYGSNNEMESFPSMEGWNELLTFVCDYNHITAIPEGMVTLEKLKRLDFTGNALSVLDPLMAHMDSLEVIKLESNPMRERSFTTMSAADIKRVLRERFAPEAEDEEPAAVVEKKYEMRPGGLLDLSNKNYEEIPADLFDSLSSSPSNLILTRNALLTIPASLSTFASLTSLNISHNKLSGTLYLPEKVTLRSLNSLVLNANNISSIVPLITNLEAPRLATLDISANRITSISGLRQAFPHLTTLFAQLNQIEEIDVDAVDGMRIVDLSSNSIAHLPPKLGNVMTLRDLKVEGNIFKSPRWQVMSKGTEFLLSVSLCI